jgi:hypothetical protein
MLSHCQNVIIGDFNIDFLTKIIQSSILHLWIKTILIPFNFFFTINDTQIDHIWTNAPIQQYHFGLAQACWTFYKPIYSALKLFDYVPQFVLLHYIKWNVLEK